MATDEHYILSDKKYEFATEYQGQDTKAININLNNSEPIINEFIYGTVKGLKTDRETKEPIKGALFGLFRADETEFTAEKAILTAESDENGIFTFENVPYGNFIICELKPADGYLENTDIHQIQISENEQVIEITAVNDKIPEHYPTIIYAIIILLNGDYLTRNAEKSAMCNALWVKNFKTMSRKMTLNIRYGNGVTIVV